MEVVDPVSRSSDLLRRARPGEWILGVFGHGPWEDPGKGRIFN